MTSPIITSLLDNDFYAFTMSCNNWLHHRDDVVTYQFISREALPLAEYVSVDQVRRQLNAIRHFRLTTEEIDYLRDLNLFPEDYLQALGELDLPQVQVEAVDGQISATVTGSWWQAIFWETPGLAVITELYQREQIRRSGLNLAAAETIAMAKLQQKIELLQQNPQVKLAEFGSRRRFSLQLQRMVIAEMIRQIPDQLIGTSNVMLAKEFGIRPIGTMAHQQDMCLAATMMSHSASSPLQLAQQQVRQEWLETFGGQLNIYLTDTFGSKFSLEHLTTDEARQWVGYRQDSGDPIEYGEYLLEWFRRQDIDPANHFMLCSDGLNIGKVVEIHRHFAGRLEVKFGVGTNLTNDAIHPGLNAVWKPVQFNGQPVVKLSDEPGKFTGQPETIARYLKESNHPEAETYIRKHHLDAILHPAA